MVNNATFERLRDQVYGKWTGRAPEQRRHADTLAFIDDLWESGIRLGTSPSLHYEHVMNVIRPRIIN